MKVIGLTGGIATGKSTVSNTIKKQGIALIDCDEIAHDVVKKGHWGYNRVIQAFGAGILKADGQLDRAALGSIVFSDKAARQKLNKATHLPVFLEILRQLVMYWLKFHAVVVVDMPLLFETGSEKFAGKTILVDCNRETQVERLMLRDSCTREQAEARVSAQMPMEQKRNFSDIVIDNNRGKEETEQQTLQVLRIVRSNSFWHQLLLGPAMAVAVLAGVGTFLTSRN